MKKALLFSLIFLFSILAVYAYETIIIKFPDGENWEKAYYKKIRGEALLQYVPVGETSDNWNRSIVIHSYEFSDYPINVFSNNNIRRMVKANPTGKYKTLKMTENDALFMRCTKDYKEIKAQCEFYRISRAHGGIITIHYMNRNKQDFMDNYTLWWEIIKGAKFYNSYWRDERTFDKSIYFEL